jgi:hypothetical protein
VSDETGFFNPVAGEADFGCFAIGLRAVQKTACGFTVVWFDFEVAEGAFE